MDIRDMAIWIAIFIVAMIPIGMALWALVAFARRIYKQGKSRWKEWEEWDKMSECNMTQEGYIERYARDNHISTEEAKEHAIVKEVLPTLEME